MHRLSVLQCVAVCCSVLQCVAVSEYAGCFTEYTLRRCAECRALLSVCRALLSVYRALLSVCRALLRISPSCSNASFQNIQANDIQSKEYHVHSTKSVWRSKEPCVYSKEPCRHSKEPHIHSKETYRHSKEPYIHSKEPYRHSKEPYVQQLCINSKKPRKWFFSEYTYRALCRNAGLFSGSVFWVYVGLFWV